LGVDSGLAHGPALMQGGPDFSARIENVGRGEPNAGQA